MIVIAAESAPIAITASAAHTTPAASDSRRVSATASANRSGSAAVSGTR